MILCVCKDETFSAILRNAVKHVHRRMEVILMFWEMDYVREVVYWL